MPSSPASSSPKSPLILLPTEIIHSILSYLSPVDLASVLASCRTLKAHALDDRLWQALVQENVPGQKVTEPYPCPDFRTLYQAHDTRWFLPKYKIWFADEDLTGRLIVVRYDQRRGCIEGYQLVAVSKEAGMTPWEYDPTISIHGFQPRVSLHLDKPILELQAVDTENMDSVREKVKWLSRFDDVTEVTGRNRSGPSYLFSHPREVPISRLTPSSKNSSFFITSLPFQTQSRYGAEIPMDCDSSPSSFCTYMPARPLSPVELQSRERPSFPYGNIWPPPTIPSPHRIRAAGPRRPHEDPLFKLEARPTSRKEISERSFRVRKWFAHWFPTEHVVDSDPILAVFARATMTPLYEEVTTYATLDPKLYTPTKERPFRGIWVGDYSGHGCEFLLLTQPDFDEEDGGGIPVISPQRKDETDEGFEKRKYEETVYRGSLEAIKLTGDPNVPRGEVTFRVHDMGPEGYVKTIEEAPFARARVVRSMGHIAHTGFQHGEFRKKKSGFR